MEGQLPGRKDSDKTVLNKMLKKCTLERGLIVAKEFDEHLMKETDRTFVPHFILPSILTIMHIRLSHPLPSQLFKIFQKYFVAFNLQKECERLSENCSFCISLARYPKELEQFNPQLVPLHPGSHMNTDVMRRAGQLIMVNCDLFSGYTTACFICTEQKPDMVQGILNLVTPMRHCSKVQLRVDRAPALKSLAENHDQELVDNGITLELGEDLNKNSNCSVDKKIQELEAEIRRLCPKETKLTTGVLCQAVINLNNRIRNQGLSARQIHFMITSSSKTNSRKESKTMKQVHIRRLQKVNDTLPQ